MDFIYAEELKTKFKIYGHFYNLIIGAEIFNCRSLLEIISADSCNPKPDAANAVVVMMNPGSSRPIDPDYVPENFTIKQIFSPSWKKDLIDTRPDNAQYQIMRLMILQKWKYIRVLNLSDLRNGNSGNFNKDFVKASTHDKTFPHSIFNPGRVNELNGYINSKSLTTVVLAWGSESILIPVANKALEFLRNYNYVGLSSDNKNPFYKYPSPYKKEAKLFWLENINNELSVLPASKK